ncbi:LuxR C-terminal-related transcriptional regulator [Cnuibacter physcomitrellae]|uniref:helix-turn-helix transcriptional regulator n=1 Tax=Cnuibacter physcomitrellae TaxID=1619308 RepID=UPI00217577B6|nr:LuxR family transcriptional regulator [Cnuibacter physcomitrellae]MCS5499027.1 LuxR C-terminal-related transcriptional regulator [Cnuibacter physcomitrellae]
MDGIMGERRTAITDAVREAVSARRWDAVVLLLEHNWSVLIAEDLPLLRDAIASLPDEVRRAQPRWEAAGAYVAHLMSSSGSAVAYRDVAPRTGADGGLLDTLTELTSRTAGRRSAGRLDEATQAARLAREALDGAPDAERVAVQYSLPHLMVQWGRSHELVGDERSALVEYTEAHDLGVITGDAVITSHAAGRIAWVHAVAGRRLPAEQWLDRIDETAPVPLRYRTGEILARALLAADVVDFAAARRHLDSLGQQAHPDSWAEQLFVRSLVARPSEVHDVLRESQQHAVSKPTALSSRGMDVGYLALSLVRVRVLERRPLRALADLTDLAPSGSGDGTRSSVMLELATAFAEAAQGDATSALRSARSVARRASARPRWCAMADLLLAVLRGEPDDRMREAAMPAVADRQLLALQVLPTRILATLGLPARELQALLALAGSREPSPTGALTPRERTVLAHLVRGETTEGIASALFVSPNTVKTQLRSIYRKLGVTRRDEAVEIARDLHLET